MRRPGAARVRRAGVSVAVSAVLLLGAALVPSTSGAFTASVTNADAAMVSSWFQCSQAFAARSSASYFEYKLDGTGSDVLDSSTGAAVNNGTLSGTVVKDDGVDQACPADDGTGRRFDGSTNAITTFGPNGTSTAPQSQAVGGSTQSFTIEVWFKTPAGAPGGKIIGFGNKQDNSSTAYDKHVYIGSSGKVLFGVNAGGAPYSTLSSAVRVNDGRWHQVVAVLSTTTGGAFYVDGTLVASNTVKSSQSITGWWRVGSGIINGANWPDVPANGGSGGWFTGTLRFAAVYKTALTKADVESDCAAGRANTSIRCGAFPLS